MRKMTLIILCSAMLAICLAGCGGVDAPEDVYTYLNMETQQDGSAAPTETTAAAEDGAEGAVEGTSESIQGGNIDFDAVFTAFAPHVVMVNIGDYDVTWEELFFYLHNNTSLLLSSFGEIADWSETLYDDVTYADIALMYSIDNALMYKAIEYGAFLNGVSLSEEDYDFLQEEFEKMAASYGGEEELLKLFWEMDGCYSREMVDYIFGTDYLANLTFSELYGDNGENLSDEDAAGLTANDGYLMAKHILLLKPEEGGDDALPEIESILRQLNTYSGDEFDEFFDGLMNEHSEDMGGLASYPEGYLFQFGDMVTSFYDACSALAVGEFSEIVESEYGYHIVYRIPINFDVVPLAFTMQGDYRTLRTYAAYISFASMMSECMESLEIEYTAEYEAMDLARLLGTA